MTRQRQLVYSIVQSSSRHLTAEEIFAEAKRCRPSIVRATIYNNLNALTEQGLIRRIRISGGPDRYDREIRPHEHLICDCCGRLSDITVGDLSSELEKMTGVKLTGYELNLHYVCPACRQKAGSGRDPGPGPQIVFPAAIRHVK